MIIKKWICGFIMAGTMSMLPFASYAANYDEIIDEIDCMEVEEGSVENYLPGVSFHRGEVISHIEAGIQDYGFGVAHVSGEVFCHHPVEAIHIRLMLQKWNETYQTWDTVNSQDFEWNAEDLPDGENLTCAYINYNIPGCQSGEVYRTKGIFGAWDEEFDDAWIGYSQGMRF